MTNPNVARLREQAARARRLSAAIGAPDVQKILLDYGAEMDAKADEIGARDAETDKGKLT